MQFLYPYFLWALAIIAVPIIIHLFYFRRFKKIYFTNVSFLKDIKEETAARSRLRNLLVLLSRILALACLVMAFALPFLHNDEARIGRKASSIFIDNSFSMEAKASDVILLEKAKALAREVINSHNDDDLFQVLTHDFEGQHQRLVDKEEAASLIDEIGTSASVRKFNNILTRQSQVLERENVEYRNIYWISDFQESIVDVDSLPDTTMNFYAIPLRSVEESNISVDSAWFASPVARLNESNTIYVRMTNRGNTDAENVRLSARHEGQEKPISVLDIPGGSTYTDTFNLSITKAGWQSVEIKITDHPVTFDDRYFLSFEVADNISILVLSSDSPSKFLTGALKSMSSVDLKTESLRQVDYAGLNTRDMVILDGVSSFSTGLINELSGFVSNGGNLLVFPPAEMDLQSFNGLLSALQTDRITQQITTEREVSYINTDEFVFSDVFARVNRNVRLPNATLSYNLDRAGRNREYLLRFRDGGAYISKYTNERGRIYLCTAPISKEFNSLVSDAEIFIPMLYKMALSTGDATDMAYTIGKDDIIDVKGQWDLENRVLEVRGENSFIPGIDRIGQKTVINLNNQINNDGVYDLMAGEERVQKLAFNYDRTESELSFINPEGLRDKWGERINIIESQSTTSLAQVLKESEEGQPLWKWLLIFTLIFLAIEQLLLRLWKI